MAVLERCSSGLRGTPGKRVYSKRVSGVRISFSPQTEKENQRQIHLNADFLFRFAPPRRRRREMSERQRRNLGEKEVRGTAYRRCRGASDEISERRRCAGPPTGDVEAPATKSPREGGARDRLLGMSEHQRTKSPREGGAQDRLREMPERQRTKSRREGGAQGRLREMSERQLTKSRREGGARDRLQEMSERQRTKSRREGGAQDRLRTRPVISDDLLNHRR